MTRKAGKFAPKAGSATRDLDKEHAHDAKEVGELYKMCSKTESQLAIATESIAALGTGAASYRRCKLGGLRKGTGMLA